MGKEQQNLDRRKFMRRCFEAGAAGAAAIGAGLYFRDFDGPIAGDEASTIRVPDFSVPVVDGKQMAVMRGNDRAKMVDAAINMLGGIGRFVQDGDIVMIKPNVAFATPASLGATVHPVLVEAVVKMCLSAGAKQVIVTDNPINDPVSCFTLSGVGRAAENAGAEVLLPKEHFFKPATLSGGKLIRNWPVYCEPLFAATKLIGISPVKHHHRAGASLSIKNFYGLLGGRRNVFHQDINGIISELSQLFKPTLVILDGVRSLVSNGPTGGSTADLRDTNTMIASCDMVAADTFAAGLLGLNAKDLPYLGLAEKAGVGTTDYRGIKAMGVDS